MVAGSNSKKLTKGARIAVTTTLGLSAAFGAVAIAPITGSGVAYAQTADTTVFTATQITGYVWNDVNKDKIANETNNALPGVRVDLIAADGTVVVSTTSDSTGRFSLSVPVGQTFTIRLTAPLGWTPVYPASGVTTDGFTYYDITYTPSKATDILQMGFTNPAVSSTNANGSAPSQPGVTTQQGQLPNQGGPAPGAPGAAIIQATASPTTVTTTIAPTTTVLDTLPPIIKPTTTVVTTTTIAASTTVAAPTFKVCGVMFNDANANGVQDGTEKGLAGVTVRVTGPNGFMHDFVADGTGGFCMEGVGAGEYTNEVIANAPAGVSLRKIRYAVNADGSVRSIAAESGAADTAAAAAPTELANTGARTRRQVAMGLSGLFAGLSLLAGASGRRRRIN